MFTLTLYETQLFTENRSFRKINTNGKGKLIAQGGRRVMFSSLINSSPHLAWRIKIHPITEIATMAKYITIFETRDI